MDIGSNKNRSNNYKTSHSGGDDVRSRLKGSEESDIYEVWADQKRIRKEDKSLEKEYKNAKAKTKALKKQLKANERLGKNDEIAINISIPQLPKIDKLKLTRLKDKLPNKHILTTKPIIICGVIVLLIFSVLIVNNLFNRDKTTSVAGSKKVEQNPDFDALESSSKSSKKPVFDEAKKVASFKDKVGSADLVVSQQKLPDTFKGDPAGKLAEFAKNNYLNDYVEVGETKVYIGQSIKGPQTLVFIKNGLLVFVSSDKTVKNSDWIEYIGLLK